LKPIRPNQLIEPDVLEKMQNVTFGDTPSALQFMQKYGTHYVNSYTTGNSLYQVKSRINNKIMNNRIVY
jgi:torso-like protein